MVGIDLPGEDRLPAGPERDLVEALHELYRRAGKPGLRRITNAIVNGEFRDTVSHETVSDMLNGKNVPRWSKLECVVRQLADWNAPRLDPDTTSARFLPLWEAATGSAPRVVPHGALRPQQVTSQSAVGQAASGLQSIPNRSPGASPADSTERTPAGATRLDATTAAPESAPWPALTDRWRLTQSQADAPGVARLGQQGFGHPAYMRPAEQTPPWVRIGAVVACDPLGDAMGWQDLRARFAALLTQESIRGLICRLTSIPGDAQWRPRGTTRRSWLEADLTGEDEATVPAASAMLFVPEDGFSLAGVQQGCAQMMLHIDFSPVRPTLISEQIIHRRPPYWRNRFQEAATLPGELADWLTHQLDLRTSAEPAAHVGIMLQAKQSITEMVDVSGIRALPSTWTANQHTGWAVADPGGRSTHDLASQLMRDLSERVLHLNGTINEMSGIGEQAEPET